MSETKSNSSLSTFPLYLWGCMAIAFTIPLAKRFVPGFIALLGIYLVYQTLRKKKFEFRIVGKGLIMLASIFLLHLIGMLYSSHTHEGWNEIGIKMSFLVFPVMGWMLPSLSHSDFHKIMRSFIWGCIAFILFALIAGTIRSVHYNNLSYLSYDKLGYFIHPSYAATYQALAIFLLLRDASGSKYLLRKKWLHVIVCSVILIFISMLASKAGLIATALAIVAGSWCWWKNKFSLSGALAILILSSAVLIGSTYSLPSYTARIEVIAQDLHTGPAQDPTARSLAPMRAETSTEIRYVTWKSSWNILKNNPMGVGTGDSESALVETFEDDSIFA